MYTTLYKYYYVNIVIYQCRKVPFFYTRHLKKRQTTFYTVVQMIKKVLI